MYQVNVIKFLFRAVFKTSLVASRHTSMKKYIALLRERILNSILAVFKGVYAGINLSISTIAIEKFFEYHSEIRTRAIDVILSAHLNDRE